MRIRTDCVEFIYKAAGVSPGSPVELCIVLLVSFVLATVFFAAVFTEIATVLGSP